MADEPETGWAYSDNEEHWNSGTDHASREDALDEARHELGHVEPGRHIFTGKAVPVEIEDIAERAADATTMIDQIESLLYDEYGGDVDTEIKASAEQIADLEQALAFAVEGWLTRHKLLPELHGIKDVRKHFVVGFVEDGPELGDLILDEDQIGVAP